MSISNFSKDVLIIASDFKEFNELEEYNKNIGKRVIERLIGRLTRLDFHNYLMVGDDSLSSEVHDALSQHGIEPILFDVYPPAAKPFIVNNVIKQSRDRYIYNSTTLPMSDAKTNNLMKLNNTLESMLGRNIKLKESISDSEKFEIIKRVLMLKYFGYPISVETLHNYDTSYPVFLIQFGTTAEELEKMIYDDLTYRWEWAQKLLEYETDEGVEGTSESIDLMELLGELEETPVKKESEITFGINQSTVTYAKATAEAPSELEGLEVNLVSGLSGLNRQQALQSESLVSEMTKTLHLIDEYSNIIYSQLIENTGLIIDLYTKRASARSRKLPYDNTNLNKMILSIDLKSGDVELYFKGSPFKLNPFFEKGETVKTNILEW